MTAHRYWNATDHSVVIDGNGKTLDGGASITMESTPAVRRAVELGTLLDQGEANPSNESEQNEEGSQNVAAAPQSARVSGKKKKED